MSALKRGTHSTLAYAASVSVDLDSDVYRSISLTGDLEFASTSNRPASGDVKDVVIFLTCDGSERTLTFNASWIFVGEKPSTIEANKHAALSLTAKGPNETDVFAAYSVES